VIGLRNRLVLNSDIVVRAAAPLRNDGVQDIPPADFVVTRTASRSPSLAVNRETAEFLLAFSQPCPLLSAVQLISKRTQSEPEAVLEELYPLLRTFLDRGILVRIGNDRRNLGVRQIGPWSLQRKINDFDDSSVYLVKNDAGQFGGLKLIRTAAAGGVIERERRVAELVGNDVCPALLDSGSSPLGAYVVSEWKPGLVAADAFRELRNSDSARPALLCLAIKVVKAFETLHERGIIHGDIQPKNVLIDLQDRAWVIDFSHSVVPDLPLPVWRMGVPFFYEPEYASASLNREITSHVPTVPGENYAVAAMLFYLLSGVHSIEFSPERETLLRQIAEVEPRRLITAKGGQWEVADQAIRPYLAKYPHQRPSSLANLREALEDIVASKTLIAATSPEGFNVRRRDEPLKRLKDEFGLGSDRLRNLEIARPRCSLTFGAAGISYALLRAAELCNDGELLWAADAWIEFAERHAADAEAFISPAIDLTRRKIGYASLACSEPGIFYVKSLVRAAVGDPGGARSAVEQFLSAASYRLSHAADVNLGGVGLALAADRLAGLPLPARSRQTLREFRNQMTEKAWQQSPPASIRNSRLGFAHGTAGMVFGALTSGSSKRVEEAAGRLRTLTVMMRKGIRWPVRAGGSYFMPGWCNGVAGHLLMWMRVWQCSGQPEDREMMERVAWGVMESRTSMGNLCCGAAGQAVALASFAAATGDPAWRRRATEFLDRLQPRWPKDDHPQSLFRGQLGLLLVRLECDSDTPRFPVWGASLQKFVSRTS
jgi:serine/threonine-protein kinase